MWIKTGTVICNTDEFTRFYIEEMPDNSYGVFGKQSEHISIILGAYRDFNRAQNAFNNFYSALERGQNAYMMQESDRIWSL